MARPFVSIILIAYDMAREIPRTVQSFLPPYQTGIGEDEVEILVMENGSSEPVPQSVRDRFGHRVRWIDVEDPHPSPARALNQGATLARGEWVCPVIDGARMASPGILAKASQAARLDGEPVIATLGYHLGPKPQPISAAQGYNQDEEDRLLAAIRWPQDGYRLFDIAALGLSARAGWLGPIAESNAIILRKAHYERLGGYDERFDLPGGGIVNHDFFRRCLEAPNSRYLLLLGEGTFHQYHDGVATSKGVDKPTGADGLTAWERYAAQYRLITGRDYAVPEIAPILFGSLNELGARALVRCVAALSKEENS
ncbi:MAG: glycosyltransferase [Pseudomonadota bacterium]